MKARFRNKAARLARIQRSIKVLETQLSGPQAKDVAEYRQSRLAELKRGEARPKK